MSARAEARRESLRAQVARLVSAGARSELEALVQAETRSARTLVGLSYHSDQRIRAEAAFGVGLVARFHPALAEQIVRRLVWAMNDESGTNAPHVPQVLQAIARERAELLVPFVPDLVRLSTDEALHDGIADVICVVVHRLPGKVGTIMGQAIEERIARGGCCERSNREQD